MADLHGKRFKCSSCGGNHSLAKYEDGDYCWRCGILNSNRNSLFSATIRLERNVENQSFITKMELEPEQIKYLENFHFDEVRILKWQIENYRYFYCNLLFLPVVIDNKVVFCQVKDPDRSEKGFKTKCYGTKPALFYNNKSLWTKALPSDVQQTIVIVEDPISAMNVADAGFNAICLFGNKLTPNMLKLITNNIKYIRGVVVWLDNDTGGVNGTTDILSKLSVWVKNEAVFTTRDPKYYNKHEIQDVVTNINSTLRLKGY